MIKHVILGTAGHIDHGKTSLVKALTGVDTDRLKEEKERGITIELGFTFLDLPSGIRLGIIDVPGHEKFVKHMVAGVWGIDLVSLIIASDEGVMPQTKEHLDICRLLKVKKGLIVLTKKDLVDNELLELVKEEVIDTVRDTFLQDAPIIPVSSITGEGIPQLIQSIDLLSREVEEKSFNGPFRLPIDRVFIIRGFGTVVTGTVVSGSLSIGETIEILPSKFEGKVRNLQVYNQTVERIFAGQRAAINLQGVEASSINRGDVLVRPNTFNTTQLIDVYLEYLPTAPRPLKNRTKQRFHIGTTLTNASILLLDKEELAPGEGGFAQLKLERPVVAMPKDRFVIRGSGVIQTSGGGLILDVCPEKHRRFSEPIIRDLILLRDGSNEEAIRQHITHSGLKGITLSELLKRVGIASDEIERIIKKGIVDGSLFLVDPEGMKIIDATQYQQLKEIALNQLREFHKRNPMKSGIPKEELRTKLPIGEDVKLFQIIINELTQSKELILEKDKLRLSGHQVSDMDERGLIKRIEESVQRGGLQPPSPKELATEWSEDEEMIQSIFEHLVHQGIFIKIKSGLYFHKVPFERLREELINYLKKNGEITTPQFKDITGVSRKYTIPLIEYFDQIKLTLRMGDKRVLRTAKD